ncbi:MAG TPA: hypothetical protein VGM37_13170 [Armatimonadota bacterium]|jgi:hypothetical protein
MGDPMTEPERRHFKRWAICLVNADYEGSLERRKVYEVLPAVPGENGLIRVIDESGEDYLYPSQMFAPLDLPAAVEYALLAAG